MGYYARNYASIIGQTLITAIDDYSKGVVIIISAPRNYVRSHLYSNSWPLSGKHFLSWQNLVWLRNHQIWLEGYTLHTFDIQHKHPYGYRESEEFPRFRGSNRCPHCLCVPCIILMPPPYLRGSASPHEANDEKRHASFGGH